MFPFIKLFFRDKFKRKKYKLFDNDDLNQPNDIDTIQTANDTDTASVSPSDEMVLIEYSQSEIREASDLENITGSAPIFGGVRTVDGKKKSFVLADEFDILNGRKAILQSSIPALYFEISRIKEEKRQLSNIVTRVPPKKKETELETAENENSTSGQQLPVYPTIEATVTKVNIEFFGNGRSVRFVEMDTFRMLARQVVPMEQIFASMTEEKNQTTREIQNLKERMNWLLDDLESDATEEKGLNDVD